MSHRHDPLLLHAGDEPLRVECPRCHLRLTQRHASLTVDLCPRCIAHAHMPVRMLPMADAADSHAA
ncbi:MAG TPA: hypothetical protein VL977_01945 [Solirubrobacteraceae bacterium]|nr:hypothetical protein [Solirubrobacteraceae bacterium]